MTKHAKIEQIQYTAAIESIQQAYELFERASGAIHLLGDMDLYDLSKPEYEPFIAARDAAWAYMANSTARSLPELAMKSIMSVYGGNYTDQIGDSLVDDARAFLAGAWPCPDSDCSVDLVV